MKTVEGKHTELTIAAASGARGRKNLGALQMELPLLPYCLNFFKNVSMEEKIFTAHKTSQQRTKQNHSHFTKNSYDLERKVKIRRKRKWANNMSRHFPEKETQTINEHLK